MDASGHNDSVQGLGVNSIGGRNTKDSPAEALPASHPRDCTRADPYLIGLPIFAPFTRSACQEKAKSLTQSGQQAIGMLSASASNSSKGLPVPIIPVDMPLCCTFMFAVKFTGFDSFYKSCLKFIRWIALQTSSFVHSVSLEVNRYVAQKLVSLQTRIKMARYSTTVPKSTSADRRGRCHTPLVEGIVLRGGHRDLPSPVDDTTAAV